MGDRMPLIEEELLFLARSSYLGGRSVRETADLLRRHLAFRSAEASPKAHPGLRLLRTGSD